MSEVEIIKTLKSLGFTEYQSRIYLTLSTRGPLNPTEISTIANMPRPNVYPSLERLVKEGLVLRESVGRGPRYLAVPFNQVSNILNNDLERKMKLLEQAKKEFDKLLSEGQYTRLSPSETAWLVSGEEKITDTFLSLLEKAQKSIIAIITPELLLPELNPELSKQIVELLKKKASSNVKIELGVKLNKQVKAALKPLENKCTVYPWTLGEVPFGSYIVDENECILTLIGKWAPFASYDLAIWVRNPVFVKSFLYLTERLLTLGASTVKT
ncbi:MAG: TrmB family transcriptional regulator [Candidatus Ranarchaeia archaeon]